MTLVQYPQDYFSNKGCPTMTVNTRKEDVCYLTLSFTKDVQLYWISNEFPERRT